jgi:hypothetical protein
MRPFCVDRDAASRFDRWVGGLRAVGVDELTMADLLIVGLVASRESNLERFRKELAGARGVGRLAVAVAERAAAADFASALSRAEAVFGHRVAQAEVRAVAGGGVGRVIPMPRRGGPVSKGLGGAAVEGRILMALGRSDTPVTKDELRRLVPGDSGAFLRVLADLVASGRVRTTGRGIRGEPKRYHLAAPSGGAA